MNAIIRTPERRAWDVFNDFDSFFNEFLPARGEAGSALIPAVDIEETDQEYRVNAELPGIKKEDLDVSIQDGVLTINAETKYEHEEKKEGRVIRQERRYGKYVRSMRLGNDVNAAKVKAEYKDGVLDLVLPKLEEVKPRKVDVAVS